MMANGMLHAIYSTFHDDCLEKRRKKGSQASVAQPAPHHGVNGWLSLLKHLRRLLRRVQ